MRKASMILGIIGGVVAILVALLAISGGVFFNTAYPEIMDKLESEGAYTVELEQAAGFEEGTRLAGQLFMGIGYVILAAGVMGLIGGIVVNKNNILAGVLMLISSVVTLFTVWAILSFILFLLGGIFALVKDSSDVQPSVQAPLEPGNQSF